MAALAWRFAGRAWHGWGSNMKERGDKPLRLSEIALFHNLGGDALQRLASVARTISLRPGQILFVQGDASNGCYPVLSGALRVSYFSAEGHETVLALLGKGDVVGEMGLFDAAPRSATVTAQTECELAFIATTEFFRCADADPPIYRHLLKLLSARLRATNDALAATTLPLSGRLARVLLLLSESFGHGLDGGRILIRQKLTQSDLCSMTGSARENVSRQLSEWRREQLVSRISSYYCLNDLAQLRLLAKR
jgi:CRP-like cAMP-binding protein